MFGFRIPVLSLTAGWLALSCSAVGAEGIEELLPADAQQFLVLHVQQIAASAASKKSPTAVKSLFARERLKDLPDTLGFDPLKDVERVVLVSPAGFNPAKAEGMLVVCGRFDSKKLALAAAALARRYKDNVAVVHDGPHVLLKLTAGIAGTRQEWYAAVVDDKRLILAPRQQDARETLDRVADKKPAVVKDAALLKALAAVDPDVSLAGRFDRAQLALVPGMDDPSSARLLDKVNVGTLEARVTSDVRLSLSLEMTDAAAARAFRPVVARLAEQVKALTQWLTLAQPGARPLADAARTLQVAVKGRAVVVQGRVGVEVLAAAVRLAGP